MVEATARDGVTMIDGGIDTEDFVDPEEPHIKELSFQRFETEKPVEVQLGEAAEGVTAYASATHFVAVRIHSVKPENPMAQLALQQGEVDEEDLEEMETTDDIATAVFLADEEFEDEPKVGAGVCEVEDGDVEDAIDKFVDENL